MNPSRILLVIISITLCSCAGHMVTSTEAPITEVKQGISYYLPKRLHKLTVTRKLRTINDGKIEKAIAVKLKALAEKSEAELKFLKLKGAFENTPGNEMDDGRTAAKKSFHLASGTYKAAKKAYETADNKAKEALEEYLEKNCKKEDNGCNYQISLKVEPLQLVPDEVFHFVAKLNHSIFRADDLKIDTTISGLLNSTTAKGTDKTGDVIVALAKSVAMLTGWPGMPPMPIKTVFESVPSVEADQEVCKAVPKKVSMILNLAKEAEVKKFNTLIEDLVRGHKYQVDISGYGVDHDNSNKPNPPISPEELPRAESCFDDQGFPKTCDFSNGLFYRRELPYLVKLIDEPDGTEKKTIVSVLAFMPNASPITQVEFEAGRLVTSDYSVTFKDGMLVSKSAIRQSEALALASLPLEVAKAVVTVLTDFVQLRVNYTVQKTELATKQKALLDALEGLRSAKERASQGEAE